MNAVQLILTGVLFLCILLAGCSSYAPPELSLVPTIKQVNASPESLSVTYDVSVDIENTGSNNAYGVEVMVLVSTPKDLPEYRFVPENIPVGTVEKRSKTTINSQLVLPMTEDNFRKLSSGERQAEVETKVIKVSSNIMG